MQVIDEAPAQAAPEMSAEWFGAELMCMGSAFQQMARGAFSAQLMRVALRVAQRLRAGGVVYWCGNGGSSSDSQHLAAELIGRFGRPGRGWPSVALSADSSVLTSCGNDFGFETVFARQVEALVRPEDVVVGISTSGASGNVVAALSAARRKGALTVALTGPNAGRVSEAAELAIRAPGKGTSAIQTCHIAIGQLLCEAAIELAEREGGDA
ncbi:MAG: SIS domain-containing protein [Dehalococcoidia bacterium]